MPGYLDDYGVVDAKRERRKKQIVIWGLAILLVGTSGFFYFRNWSEERTIDRFFGLLKEQKYSDAYKLWQTPESAKFYPPQKFTEDWGPNGIYKNASSLKIRNVDACNAGVVFWVSYSGAEDFGLWVDRSTGIVSFAPWVRCPGRHLRIWEFLKERFG